MKGLIFLVFSLLSINCMAKESSCNSDTVIVKQAAEGRRVVITGVGDIMLGTAFPSERFLPPHNNPYPLLESVAGILASSGLTFGNLEGPFLNFGDPVKKCKDTSICYLFRVPENYITALTSSGFDLFSLANNHFGDFGDAGRNRTKAILDSIGIHYGGLIENPWSIFRKDSILYGFCAFAPNAGTVNINDTAGAGEIVRMLSDTCDIVIVSFHGGAEGADYQHVPRKSEIFYGENRGDVYNFAHSMIDNGADIIFGHGPHVTRAIEVYKDRFISYSMGNFCTYGRFNLNGPNGIAPIINISVDAAGKFLAGRIIPVYQPWPGGVKIDESMRVITKIRELTSVDFPETMITISENGEITYK